jgi:hypothetical protein
MTIFPVFYIIINYLGREQGLMPEQCGLYHITPAWAVCMTEKRARSPDLSQLGHPNRMVSMYICA